MAKNQMVYGKDDNWNGYGLVSEIRGWASHKDDCGHKENMRDIRLWNKMAKALAINNPDICSKWKEIKADYANQNHICQFVKEIFYNIKKGKFELDQLGKIEGLDDGSRGLASTSQMHLSDTKGDLIDVASIQYNKYYYM